MKNVILNAGAEHDFFQRGKTLARLVDMGKPLPEERTVSFAEGPRPLRVPWPRTFAWGPPWRQARCKLGLLKQGRRVC